MVSQRGVLNLCPQRRASAMPSSGAATPCGSHGVDAELLDRKRVRALRPSSTSTMRAFRSAAGCCSRAAARCGTTPWPGVMRAAPMRSASTSSRTAKSPASIAIGEVVTGVETTRGSIRRDEVGACAPATSSRARAIAGLRLPIESHVLQAFVSEAIKPVIGGVITFGAGHFYVSQSDKGGLVFGGDMDGYNSYAQRGNCRWSRMCSKAAWR